MPHRAKSHEEWISPSVLSLLKNYRYQLFHGCPHQFASPVLILSGIVFTFWNEKVEQWKSYRVFFYNSHRVKSSLLSLELPFRSLLKGRQTSI